MTNLKLENLHILLVDDDDNNRTLLETYLMTQGAQVTSCDDGESAYQKFSIQEFNCIVSDIHMPIMNGIELLSKIRHIQVCDTPLILISGDAEFTESELIYKGAQGFLKKPFLLQSLKNMILACDI